MHSARAENPIYIATAMNFHYGDSFNHIMSGKPANHWLLNHTHILHAESEACVCVSHVSFLPAAQPREMCSVAFCRHELQVMMLLLL